MSATTSGNPEMTPVRRSLHALAAASGCVSMLALDHRDAMRNSYRRLGVGEVDEATMVAAKAEIAATLGASCSSLLIDPAALERCRRPGLALMMPLEQQGHEELEGGRLNALLEDFSPGQAAELGASACKILLYYRADHRPSATRQRELVENAAAECHRHGLALIVEPKLYLLPGETDEGLGPSFADLVVAGAAELSDSGADLLKVEYPGEAAACERISEAAAPLNWTLLGGNEVDGSTFAEQLEAACQGGASGFIAGRAIWGGALAEPADQQAGWLRDNALPIFDRLVDITERNARRLT